MSLRLEHLVTPFSLMSEDEQLALIREIRRKRFFVKPTMAKTKAKKIEKKTTTRKKASSHEAVAAYLASLSPEERKALLDKASG